MSLYIFAKVSGTLKSRIQESHTLPILMETFICEVDLEHIQNAVGVSLTALSIFLSLPTGLVGRLRFISRGLF